MSQDMLYSDIMRDTQPGDGPFSVRDVARRWARSEKHSQTVLEWMTERDSPPTMRIVPRTSPQLWRRI